MPHCIPTHLNTFCWFSHISFMATTIIFCGFICMGQMQKNPYLRSLLTKSLVCPHDEAIVYGHQPYFSHTHIYIYIYRILLHTLYIHSIYICIVHIRIYIYIFIAEFPKKCVHVHTYLHSTQSISPMK